MDFPVFTRVLWLLSLLAISLLRGAQGLETPNAFNFHHDVAIGSTVTIRHLNSGGYLHSNGLFYPTGSRQRQVSVHQQEDFSNEWQIFNTTSDQYIDDTFDWKTVPLIYLSQSSRVKLRHVTTQTHLHSHDYRQTLLGASPAEDDSDREVTTYGMRGFIGDQNDNWVFKFHMSEEHLTSQQTTFRLLHDLQGCYLTSQNTTLPEWGLREREVTCSRNATQDTDLWIIETTSHPLLLTSASDAFVVEEQAPQLGC